ncbi:hypothetical protein B5X24_HaOG207896 [Helicoverpa armigera]|uniref:Uncharacterized protein n=1 Tax=Helicoverpa armigera TaxID=29058 RepID=A0A2W1BH43_HELAM|nr:hypothetical protein B5X24_HaOG207896 [Helicoverpa armigera]
MLRLQGVLLQSSLHEDNMMQRKIVTLLTVALVFQLLCPIEVSSYRIPRDTWHNIQDTLKDFGYNVKTVAGNVGSSLKSFFKNAWREIQNMAS